MRIHCDYFFFNKKKFYVFGNLLLTTLTTPTLAQALSEEKKNNPGTTLPNKVTESSKEEHIKVIGKNQLGLTTENTHSYATKYSFAATRLPLSLQETPQSVVVVTRQRINDQDMRTVENVATNIAGFSLTTLDTERVSLTSRGFNVDSFQFDGIPTLFVGTGVTSRLRNLDMAVYDRVEIVRGSTGLTTGSGQPGASVNLVRKHAYKNFNANASFSGGRWDDYRSVIDINMPITVDARIRGRLVGVYETKNTFVKGMHIDKGIIYGIIDTSVTEGTTFSVGDQYMNYQITGNQYGGLPLLYNDGTTTKWDRSATTAPKWAKAPFIMNTVFATLNHQFVNGWHISTNYNHMNTMSKSYFLGLRGAIDRSTGNWDSSTQQRRGTKGDSTSQQDSIDLILNAPFNLFNRYHDLVIGFMETWYNDDEYGYGRMDDPSKPGGVWRGIYADPGSFYDWPTIRNFYPEPNLTTARYDHSISRNIRQSGGYAAVKFSILDPLLLITGGRVNGYEITDNIRKSHYNKNGYFTPYVGLVFHATPNLTPYISYTQIYNPQPTQLDFAGKPLKPENGETSETGIKSSWFSDRLQISMALFDIRKNYVAQTDPQGRKVPGTTKDAVISVSNTKSQGFDLDITGEILPRWNMYIGYSHFTATTPDGRLHPSIPRSTFKMFTSYRFYGLLHNWKIGGGINWQSQFFYSNSSSNVRFSPNKTYNFVWRNHGQPAYALVSLMMRYDINHHWNVQGNITNLFDKSFVSQYGFNQTYLYGEPRSFMLSLNYKM